MTDHFVIDQAWPDGRSRRTLLYVVGLCAAIVALLGLAVFRTVASFSVRDDMRHYFLGLPIDAFPIGDLGKNHGARLLVIFGEPQVFAVAVAILVVISLLAHDKRLALIAAVAPITAEILAEWILKPWIHRMAGQFYTFPSGHVTACASIVAVFALYLRRVAGRRIAAIFAPFLVLYVLGSMYGVIVLHMHDLLDAIGGAAVGVGMVCLFTDLITQSFRANASKISAPTN